MEYANDENNGDENSEFLSADVSTDNITKNIELENKVSKILENAKTMANEYDKEIKENLSNLDYFGDWKITRGVFECW